MGERGSKSTRRDSSLASGSRANVCMAHVPMQHLRPCFCLVFTRLASSCRNSSGCRSSHSGRPASSPESDLCRRRTPVASRYVAARNCFPRAGQFLAKLAMLSNPIRSQIKTSVGVLLCASDPRNCPATTIGLCFELVKSNASGASNGFCHCLLAFSKTLNVSCRNEQHFQ